MAHSVNQFLTGFEVSDAAGPKEAYKIHPKNVSCRVLCIRSKPVNYQALSVLYMYMYIHSSTMMSNQQHGTLLRGPAWRMRPSSIQLIHTCTVTKLLECTCTVDPINARQTCIHFINSGRLKATLTYTNTQTHTYNCRVLNELTA